MVETKAPEWALANGGFAGRIAALDDAALEALLVARPDLADPEPSTLEELARRAVSPPSVWNCFKTLDRPTRRARGDLHPRGPGAL